MSLVHALACQITACQILELLHRSVVIKHIGGGHKLFCNLTPQVGTPRRFVSQTLLRSSSSRAKGLYLRIEIAWVLEVVVWIIVWIHFGVERIAANQC